ncbi:hypothetical protein GUITHDRAFT_160003 [Guillardia theta CCMP2712]|uniref:RRM domain-containing protein n=1 Tax=Guillardia theta (strain CCMP2712) TaxID=905079 RepID=L1ITL9_GUITC|nr:hypothetical protein GUITHDRAFT_160003 [Guillardia theta CCMP2712]EKX39611.1 hypothetical protein GUITHDRAFT_160003 [Guillardia theta CCMP2712]|eukprot:XP_005826591.1 hypothetical protein GUITHDRAFT_160003 [Guillardia theta CCMP2712]
MLEDTRGPGLGCRVYVGNLSWDAQWQDLKDHMRGPNQNLNVVHADIMYEAGGRSKGCAIVEYASPEDAQRAIAELNDTEMMGRLIFVREDREGFKGGMGTGGRRVYVGNLSWECKWQDLKDHMRTAGNVLHADVMTGPDGRSKGCGLVEFSSPEEAVRAIQELNETELMGRMIFVREDREMR